MSSGRPAWSKAQRLLRAPEFASLAGPQANWRASRRWLALSVRIQMPETGSSAAPSAGARNLPTEWVLPARPHAAVRFGLTVSKRQARRAVARNAVKRVLREAARHAAAPLEAAARGARVDVLFRLKSPLPAPAAATWAEVKAGLRQEADSLLRQLAGELARPQRGPRRAGGAEAGEAGQVLAQSPAGAAAAGSGEGAA